MVLFLWILVVQNKIFEICQTLWPFYRFVEILGPALTSGNIIIEKTVITKPPESLSYRQTGVDTSFFCDAVFEKETLGWTFQWLRDGAVIEDSDTIFKEPRLTGISRILFVKDIQTSYNGEFTCQVYTYEQDGSKRIISEDRKSATLSVIGMFFIGY